MTVSAASVTRPLIDILWAEPKDAAAMIVTIRFMSRSKMFISTPSPKRMRDSAMKREEILKAYKAGPEAVVELAESLLERIKQLEDQINKNSRNSSKPPSTDGFKKPQPKRLREKGKRPVGGQNGHPGRTLSMTEQPDHVVVHPVLTCSCGHTVCSVTKTKKYP